MKHRLIFLFLAVLFCGIATGQDITASRDVGEKAVTDLYNSAVAATDRAAKAEASLKTASEQVEILSARVKLLEASTRPVPAPGYDLIIKPGDSLAGVKPGMRVQLVGDWSGKTFFPVGGALGNRVSYYLPDTLNGMGKVQQAIDFRIAAGKWVQHVNLYGGKIRDYDGGSFNHMAVVRHGPNVTIDGLQATECTGHVMGVNDTTGVVWRNLDISGNWGSPFNGASGKGMLVEDSHFDRNNRGHKRQIGKDRCFELNGLGYFILTYEFAKFAQTDGIVFRGCTFDNNNGQGLWLDPANENYLIENCFARGNKGLRGKWEGCGILSELSLGGGVIRNCTFSGNTGNGIVIAECEDLKGGIATSVIGCTFASFKDATFVAKGDTDNNNLALRDMNKPAPNNRKITNFNGTGKDQPMRLFGVSIEGNTFKDGAGVSQGGDGWGKDKLSDRNVVLKNNVGLN
jgi:hypothetical protein